MNTQNHKVELLAPAGNAAAFYGAVKAGADAVYLAGERFGARAYAENFTTDSLIGCIRYAHLFGRRVYLAVNTLLKENELAELDQYLEPFYEAGLDAVIVQDLGVLRLIRERFPDLEIHASTQMSLCGGYGAAMLKKMGVSRIVPARELSLKELAAVKEHTDIEIEAFVHGAMCYSYSGQCLFSSILGGRSGNRGCCAQPCRLPYNVSCKTLDHRYEKASRPSSDKKKDIGEYYPLSLKDMCTIRLLPQLIEAGIDSFKIEGRMKKPEYAAGVTAVYRKYIDKYYELRQKLPPEGAAAAYEVDGKDYRLLTSLYIRSQVQEGYYFRRNGRKMVTLGSPAYSGSDETALTEIAAKYLASPLKLPVTAAARFETGSPASVSLRWQELSVTACGEIVQPARNQPVTSENVKKQLGRFGDSSFAAAEMQVSVSGDAFYPLGQINELRRKAAAQLERLILEKNGYPERIPFPEDGNQEKRDRNDEEKKTDRPSARNRTQDVFKEVSGWAVSLRTMDQLGLLEKWILEGRRRPDRIYVEGDLLVQEPAESLKVCGRLTAHSRLWITLPYILRLEDTAYMERILGLARETGCFQGFLARSLDEIGFLKEQRAFEKGLECRADAGLYVWNREALQELADLGVSGFCLPYELQAAEQRALLASAKAGASLREAEASAGMPLPEKIFYSRIPMMLTANCVLRTAAGCRKGGGEDICLTDRYRKRFPVLRNCLHCMNIIYNSVPFSLHRERTRWNGICRRLDFTLESAGEMRAVLEAFWEERCFPFQEYTTGHERRGLSG